MMRIAAFILLLSLLVSCRNLKPPVFNGIGNVRVGKLSLSESAVTLDLNFFNPNHMRARLKEAQGDAWMDSIFLGHFVVDTAIAIPANSDFVVPVKLNVDMKYMLQLSLVAFGNDEVTITLKGNARVGKAGIYRSYPLDYSGKQNPGKLLQ